MTEYQYAVRYKPSHNMQMADVDRWRVQTMIDQEHAERTYEEMQVRVPDWYSEIEIVRRPKDWEPLPTFDLPPSTEHYTAFVGTELYEGEECEARLDQSDYCRNTPKMYFLAHSNFPHQRRVSIVRWHACSEEHADLLAKELTKIGWTVK